MIFYLGPRPLCEVVTPSTRRWSPKALLVCYLCGEPWARIDGGGRAWTSLPSLCKRCPGEGDYCPGSFLTPFVLHNLSSEGEVPQGLARLRLAHGAPTDPLSSLLLASPPLLRHEFNAWTSYATR